jgi:predicted ATPase/class 3 adenylate cyclase/Tfp pilus assembly protein PilF
MCRAHGPVKRAAVLGSAPEARHHRAMRQLPAGTVTTLFTDIEGSTRLLQELGHDRYLEHLRLHRELVRDAFSSHGGVEVEMQGDSFHFSFTRAADAVCAAADAQHALAAAVWPHGEPIRVRIGVHTGEPVAADGLYVGLDIHRAARVMQAAHGGQVLLSATTAALLDDELSAEMTLRDLGPHRLKDLAAPQRLYQLGTGDFPPPKTLHQTNLPVVATPFLGRDREVGEVLALLERARLVTLTGTGGTGKTRLALQVAAEAAHEFEDGAFWVGLAPLREHELVLPTIAQTLSAHDDLASHIGDKRMLVLVDNFEQVLDAAPELGQLLAASPNLKLLVTSREPLHLEGEWEYAVQPLGRAEAVALFELRARAIKSDFSPNEVAEICDRLDCLPLAVELAAARVKVLSPSAILERLEQRLPLLTGGARDVPERQRTLRATIEWSYDLLTGEDQQLFARFAVFAGGCTLAAAEQVCYADLDAIQSLVEKSLIRQTNDRFWMLETIREYAAQRFSELPDGEALRRGHARHFLHLAESEEMQLLREGEPEALARLNADLPNLRLALETAIEDRDGETALRLCGALHPFWYRGSFFEEGRYWSEQALDLDGPPDARERALGAAAEFALLQGATDAAREHLRERLTLGERIGDPGRLSAIHTLFGHLAFAEADLEHALDEYTHALRLEEEAIDRTSVWQSRATALNNVGWALLHLGRLEEAQEHLEGSLEAARLEGTTIVQAAAFNNLARVALAQRDLGALREFLARSLSVLQTALDLHILSEWFALLARLLVAEGAPERAAHAAGAASRLQERLGVSTELEAVPDVAWLEAAQAEVGEDKWEADLLAGAAAADEDALGTAQSYLR